MLILEMPYRNMALYNPCHEKVIVMIIVLWRHFWKIKNEMYYGNEKDYSSFEEFSKAIEEYIDYYNNKRIQAKTKWMPPVQYRIASMCST